MNVVNIVPSSVLALDLGTSLGWATVKAFDKFEAGTEVLATPKNLKLAKNLRMDRRLDIRASRMAYWLSNQPSPDLLVFEDVRFASSQAQAHLWASFRGIVWAYAHEHAIVTDCLDTSKLKLWTTGAGNATKEMMAAAAAKRWPWLGTDKYDDNAVDAICLLQWARETYRIP